MVYDLSIPFLLLTKRYRGIAYAAVIVFHVMTRILFQIGMFPFVMIGATLIFFPADIHKKIIDRLRTLLPEVCTGIPETYYVFRQTLYTKMLLAVCICFVTFQLLFPFRYLFYPGKLFWTEQGFRFSWRVMLMEKMGACYFYVKNPDNGWQTEVNIHEYLTPQQEKMMSTQPDMILQFAHHLGEVYKQKGISNPEVRVLSYVAFNGRMSRLFIDQHVDLMKQKDSFCEKKWLVPYSEE